MTPEFWQQRWQEKRIGFNQPEVNPLLIRYFSKLDLPVGCRVMVPLCGKSIDMVWLTMQGYDVVGVELVESAIQEFFTEQAISYTIIEDVENPNNKCYQGQLAGQSIELWVADIFTLSATTIGHVDAVYDRAALIAMSAKMRPTYAKQVSNISQNAAQLLLTIHYDQNEWSGPPFAVSGEEVQQYYGAQYNITALESEPSSLNAAPELAVTEHVWWLSEK